MGFLPAGVKGRDRRVMLALLPTGAWLSFTAGFVNSALLLWVGMPVSHMSGAATHLSLNLAGHRESMLGLIVAVMGSFLLGAVISGALIGVKRFSMGGRYGVALLIEAGLLLLAGWMAGRGWVWALPVAALACGLQNAMAASFRGVVLRTTHVTGIVTDLGLMIGHRLRRHPISGYQFTLLLLLLAGFVLGGIAGAVGLDRVGPGVIAYPALPCAVAGGVYLIWRMRVRGRAR